MWVATASGPTSAAAPRSCVSPSFHGRTLRLTVNNQQASVDSEGCCLCPMPPPCLVCCCEGLTQGRGGNAIQVRYDASSGILTRTDGCAGSCGLALNQDWDKVSPGTEISSFRCGVTPWCAHSSMRFDLMSDGTIVPRKDHTVCVGFEGSKAKLVSQGSVNACVFDDILRGASVAGTALGHMAMERGARIGGLHQVDMVQGHVVTAQPASQVQVQMQA